MSTDKKQKSGWGEPVAQAATNLLHTFPWTSAPSGPEEDKD